MTDHFSAPVASNLLTNDKVYVVWYDNGEPYEDGFSDIDAIFKTVEEAKRYVKEEGYTRKESYGLHINTGKYTIVDDVCYHSPSLEDSWWGDSSLEIREYALRTDNTDYNEEGTGV